MPISTKHLKLCMDTDILASLHFDAAGLVAAIAQQHDTGEVLMLVEMRLDCDGDAVLLLVDQLGVACHTGRRSCFYTAIRDGELVEISAPLVTPEALYGT